MHRMLYILMHSVNLFMTINMWKLNILFYSVSKDMGQLKFLSLIRSSICNGNSSSAERSSKKMFGKSIHFRSLLVKVQQAKYCSLPKLSRALKISLRPRLQSPLRFLTKKVCNKMTMGSPIYYKKLKFTGH